MSAQVIDMHDEETRKRVKARAKRKRLVKIKEKFDKHKPDIVVGATAGVTGIILATVLHQGYRRHYRRTTLIKTGRVAGKLLRDAAFLVSHEDLDAVLNGDNVTFTGPRGTFALSVHGEDI